MVLIPMTTSEPAIGVANKLRQAIELATFQHKGKRERVTISCGVTEFRQGDTPPVFTTAPTARLSSQGRGPQPLHRRLTVGYHQPPIVRG